MEDEQAWLEEKSRFVTWVSQSVQRVAVVNQSMPVLEAAPQTGGVALADVLAVRDAALRMQVLTFEGGFLSMAAMFSQIYDRYCRLLLSGVA